MDNVYRLVTLGRRPKRWYVDLLRANGISGNGSKIDVQRRLIRYVCRKQTQETRKKRWEFESGLCLLLHFTRLVPDLARAVLEFGSPPPTSDSFQSTFKYVFNAEQPQTTFDCGYGEVMVVNQGLTCPETPSDVFAVVTLVQIHTGEIFYDVDVRDIRLTMKSAQNWIDNETIADYAGYASLSREAELLLTEDLCHVKMEVDCLEHFCKVLATRT